ncbi:MAG: prolyl oligopeptidase family serine peptidase [Pirellulales bacterium]
MLANARLNRFPATGTKNVAGRLTVLVGLIAGLAASHAEAESYRDRFEENNSSARLAYPLARRSDQVDWYHGIAVPDPYRWLEDSRLPETRQWVTAQNQLTRSFLERNPRRSWIRQRIEELSSYDRTSIPAVRGGRYFFQRNDSQGSQPRLHVAESLHAASRVLLDPNRIDAQGSVFLSGWRVSGDGRHLAYGLGRAGSDWRTLQVRDVTTGQDLADTLRWVKFSDIAWDAQGQGFFYSRFPEPLAGAEHTAINDRQRLYYHRLGEPQSSDRLIYERPDLTDYSYDAEVTDDGRYLVIRVWRGVDRDHRLLVKDLSVTNSPVVELLDGVQAQFRLIGSEGTVLWLLTDYQAPRGRVIAVNLAENEASSKASSKATDVELQPRQDVENAREAAFTTVIAQTEDVLQDANVIGDLMVAKYLHNAEHRVLVFDLAGKRKYELKFAQAGSIEGFAGRRGDAESFFAFSNFLHPAIIYRFDARTGECSPFHSPRLPYRADDYQMSRLFYASRDGTQVPLHIVARRDLPLDGNRPTLLIGYGGFNVSLTPAFAITNLVWLEMGGVLAIANVRGGGEYGREWHDAGRRQFKQNGIDDFIAAAEWLIENRYTNAGRLAIAGRSNGGLLVGAAMTQRPELFAAALPGVGVLDMLRYQKFTIGRAWIPEYGVAEDPADFPILRAYSPLHNVRPGREYPATLISTADHDDRVVPAHSFKFAAELQAAQVRLLSETNGAAQARPILLRVDTGVGHGSGMPANKLIEASTDTLSFLSSTLHLEP